MNNKLYKISVFFIYMIIMVGVVFAVTQKDDGTEQSYFHSNEYKIEKLERRIKKLEDKVKKIEHYIRRNK